MPHPAYPELQIDQTKIYENVSKVVDLCAQQGISVSGVIKGVNGEMGVAAGFLAGGCAHIASSRVEQLRHMKEQHPQTKTLLLRIPMRCELDEAVRYCDISLNSERKTIDWLEAACEAAELTHGVILMADLGDLREGFTAPEELIALAEHIEQDLKRVKLMGVGTNLGCYGAIKPTEQNLGQLCAIAEQIEARIGRTLEIISGGATSSLPLLQSGRMPKRINNLRVGEGILLNMDLPELWNVHIAGLHQDAFTLRAQIVEIKEKPSYPIGEIFIDAFGNTPNYEDRGVRKRAILAMGKQDFAMDDKLIPREPGVQVVGSSSDHLIVDLEDCQEAYEVGDLLSFGVFYGPMLHLCTSPHIRKTYANPIAGR